MSTFHSLGSCYFHQACLLLGASGRSRVQDHWFQKEAEPWLIEASLLAAPTTTPALLGSSGMGEPTVPFERDRAIDPQGFS